MVFIQNVASLDGVWRQHLKLLQNIYEVVHLFYMPEIHTVLVPLIQDFTLEGNTFVRNQGAKCLAKIITRQHHVPAREELIEFVITKLYQSKNFSHRSTYIQFCVFMIDMIPFSMFNERFGALLFNLHKDKIPKIRADLAKALVVVKPFYDSKEEGALQITDILQTLLQDKNPEVVEAAEHAEF